MKPTPSPASRRPGHHRLVLGLLPLFVAACSSSAGSVAANADSGSPPLDAGVAVVHDGGRDAGRGAAETGAADAGHDSSVAATTDSATDVTGDAAFDTGVDAAGADASASDSAASDANDARASGDGGWTFHPTTTASALTQNNTSACGSGAAPCSEGWDPTETVRYGSGTYDGTSRTVTAFWDHAVPGGARSPGSAQGYVSKVPMSALLPGQTVPVWVETQDWWGNGSGHIDNGEVSSSSQQIQDQIADHVSRGVAGQVLDWYGPGTTADKSLPTVRTSAEATGGKYKFAVMIDKGYFTTCGETVACLNSALTYLTQQYTGSSAYLTDGDGHPLVFFFINSYYPTQYAILQASGIDYQGTRFVMYEPNGFSGNAPPNTIGEYAWVNPADGTDVSSSGDAGTFATAPDFGFKDLTSFFGAAKNDSTAFAVSEAHKGFDDNLANWSLDRVIDQQCGRTWLETFDHTGSFGGSASYLGNLNYLASGGRLDFVMVDTWDDYEEGTEIETGIDNCLSKLDVTLSGSTLSWSPTWGTDPMNAAVTGTEDTVYAYAVYVAKAGSTDVMWLANVACSGGTCGHSLDLSTFGITGGPYAFYVQAVGYPSIVNTLSGATTATFTGG